MCIFASFLTILTKPIFSKDWGFIAFWSNANTKIKNGSLIIKIGSQIRPTLSSNTIALHCRINPAGKVKINVTYKFDGLAPSRGIFRITSFLDSSGLSTRRDTKVLKNYNIFNPFPSFLHFLHQAINCLSLLCHLGNFKLSFL